VLQANCPSCAAPIEFQAGSTIVLVCPYCRSAVARTDRGLADLGKVAEIAESESPLRLGLKGQFNGTRFELTGRAQMRHELGGFWDEWYATFSNGWVGWLAEAQGRFYLTFYQPAASGAAALPTFDQLTPGQFVPEIQSETPLMVQEKGVATAVAADGEIPYLLTPGETSGYADLAGKNDAFATIDYSMSPPWVFVGRQVALADIGLADARPAEREKRRVSAAAMGCPNCGGPLNLVAPDKAERVTCPNCNSLLDVNQGNLSYLHALEPTNADKSFVLSVGAEGTFNDVRYKIIGAVIRSVLIDSVHYYWHEYLLYNPSVGFRWLVHSDNHWNFVEPVNPAEVESDPGAYLAEGPTIRFRGQTFKVFQDANARVEYVQGEFYWRVEQGETVRAADYVAAPLMLSRESSSNEINWSLGTFLTVADVEKAFGIQDLPKPWGVAPNQPFTGSFYYTWGLLPLVGLLLVAAIMIPLAGTTSTVLSETVTMQPAAPGASTTVFSQPFQLKSNRNVRISASAAFSNSGADLDIDLVDDKKNDVETVNIPISYFQGVEDGESWTEGSPSDSATTSSLPAGTYNLRIDGTFENITQPLPVTLKVEQNVNRGVNFGCALIALLIVPFVGLIRKWSFEGRKWKDSMFTVDTSDDSE
jgi:hypothetical protein